MFQLTQEIMHQVSLLPLAVMAALSFLIAFYLSLTRPWRLRRRMTVAVALAMAAAAALEGVKLMSAGRANVAGLAEHAIAAVGGVLLFAGLWQILDRRGARPVEIAYTGPERRTGRENRPITA